MALYIFVLFCLYHHFTENNLYVSELYTEKPWLITVNNILCPSRSTPFWHRCASRTTSTNEWPPFSAPKWRTPSTSGRPRCWWRTRTFRSCRTAAVSGCVVPYGSDFIEKFVQMFVFWFECLYILYFKYFFFFNIFNDNSRLYDMFAYQNLDIKTKLNQLIEISRIYSCEHKSCHLTELVFCCCCLYFCNKINWTFWKSF